jgi:hypothetical protein
MPPRNTAFTALSRRFAWSWSMTGFRSGSPRSSPLPSTRRFFSDAKTKLGVKPGALPPIYPPEMVAEAIVHAASHADKNEVIVGGAGKVMAAGQRLSPRLMDKMIGAVGFKGQKTSEQKSESAPNNLYGPVRDERVKGDFTKVEKASQIGQWLLLGGTLAAAAYYGTPRVWEEYRKYKADHDGGSQGTTATVNHTRITPANGTSVTTTPEVTVSETRTVDVPVDLHPVQG